MSVAAVPVVVPPADAAAVAVVDRLGAVQLPPAAAAGRPAPLPAPRLGPGGGPARQVALAAGHPEMGIKLFPLFCNSAMKFSSD